MAEETEQHPQMSTFGMDEMAQNARPDEPSLSQLRKMGGAETPEETAAHTCPHCLRRSDEKVGMPTTEDKQGWLRVIMGCERFVKVYKLCNGQVTVTFRNRSLHERDLITKQLEKELTSGELPSGSSASSAMICTARATDLKMVLSLVAFNNHTFGTSAKDKDLDKMYAHIADVLSEDMYVLVRQAFIEFETLCNNLRLGAASPDFWQGTKSQG